MTRIVNAPGADREFARGVAAYERARTRDCLRGAADWATSFGEQAPAYCAEMLRYAFRHARNAGHALARAGM